MEGQLRMNSEQSFLQVNGFFRTGNNDVKEWFLPFGGEDAVYNTEAVLWSGDGLDH